MTKGRKVKLRDAVKGHWVLSEETRRRMSAAKQGIPRDEWCGYANEQKYCHNFNSSCREQNRDKYDHQCFLCGKHEDDENRKLSVHHVDMNKDQGCNGHEWKLVPLCHACHARVHHTTWQARIEYLLSSVKP